MLKKNINGSTIEITEVMPAKNSDIKNVNAKKFPSKPSLANSVGSEMKASPAPFDGSEPNSNVNVKTIRPIMTLIMIFAKTTYSEEVNKFVSSLRLDE